MKCVIANTNVKRFGRAFHALGKLGDVVYVEISSECFLLHTVNSSRSAYGSFKFLPSFFSSFSFVNQVNCKVAIKSCFMVFKSLFAMDKNTERCCFEFLGDSDSLCIKLFCKHDVIKTHTLPFIECEALKTSFKKNQNKNVLSAPSRLLGGCISNFQSSVDEMTLIVTSGKISLKNYTDDEKDPTKVVHTEVAFELEEFDRHEFENDAEITFCLKEFKAILSYVEGTNPPLIIRFDVAGQPVIFSIEDYFEIEIDFILATLADKPLSKNNSNENLASNDKPKPVQQSKKSTLTVPSKLSTKPSTSTAVLLSESQSSRANKKNIQPGNSIANNLPNKQNIVTLSGISQPQDNRSDSVPLTISQISLSSSRRSSTSFIAGKSTQARSPEVVDLAMDQDEVIPSTPPKKRFRDEFLGLSNLSQFTSLIAEPDPVLVNASDDED